MYILTTNLRDDLDAALVRNGRVDYQVNATAGPPGTTHPPLTSRRCHQVRFDHATDEQIEKMWDAFYPPPSGAMAAGDGEHKAVDGTSGDVEVECAGVEVGLAEAFRVAVRASLGGRPVACCSLQHFFVTQRRRTAAQALAAVGELLEDLRRREAEDAGDGAAKGTKKKKKGTKGGKGDESGSK